MRELLNLFPKPTHYLGAEPNAVKKDPTSVDIRIALAFPDVYEVAMSYTGQKILYHCINRFPAFWAERVFAPGLEVADLLKKKHVRLATLESDTPLLETDVVAFSLTHELCYTNVLYMLELAGIPLRAKDRNSSHPLIIAGGGATFNAEPMAPFFDGMVVGDGEEVIVELLHKIRSSRQKKEDRRNVLKELTSIPGMYIPAFFQDKGQGTPLVPTLKGYEQVEKSVVPDLDEVPFPTHQTVPIGRAIHDRFSMEIARGCTRGCRFCHAGMVYRPARERSLHNLQKILEQGLHASGYEELSFLSLSTGDFSALSALFEQSIGKCIEEQISISLPSLRVGSLHSDLLGMIAGLRRTGVTLAPEAGSQRLRNVINKGITEQELLEHTRQLFSMGWNGVKLYFMIGLPTEQWEDLDAILDVCLKVKKSAEGKAKRLNITASISPFVPKPHTPFQWERQLSRNEVKKRLEYLQSIFRPHKRLNLRWHDPDMSYLEGIFSRGDRRLSSLLECAFQKGEVFTSWKDSFHLKVWLQCMEETGIEGEEYLQARNPDAPLPWDHINSGVTRTFLKREQERALQEKTSKDCRYNACLQCGVCNDGLKHSTLCKQDSRLQIKNQLNSIQRDQVVQKQKKDLSRESAVTEKKQHLRIWYEKMGPARYLSQLELQKIIERGLRKARIPLTFSAGYHPMPRLSFGKALPVGVASRQEWFRVFLREETNERELPERLKGCFPEGMDVFYAEQLSYKEKGDPVQAEDYVVRWNSSDRETELFAQRLKDFLKSKEWTVPLPSKKGEREVDIRPFVLEAKKRGEAEFILRMNWTEKYISPVKVMTSIFGSDISNMDITKEKQWLSEEYKGRELA